jgi:hypothetical protein
MNWDAYYCKDCNEWERKHCVDKTCALCEYRPETPIKDKRNKLSEKISEFLFDKKKIHW